MMISEEKQYVQGLINDLKKKVKLLDEPFEQNRLKNIIKKFEKGMVEDLYPVDNSIYENTTESAIVSFNQNELNRNYFSVSTVRNLIKGKASIWISKLAIYYLIADLEEKAMKISRKAQLIAENSGRKTLSKNDIELAIKYLS